jgi:hypothetical protein
MVTVELTRMIYLTHHILVASIEICSIKDVTL